MRQYFATKYPALPKYQKTSLFPTNFPIRIGTTNWKNFHNNRVREPGIAPTLVTGRSAPPWASGVHILFNDTIDPAMIKGFVRHRPNP